MQVYIKTLIDRSEIKQENNRSEVKQENDECCGECCSCKDCGCKCECCKECC